MMKFDDPISSVLERKGKDVFSVPLDATVYRALTLMADHDIGSVLVKANGVPVGIFSERDYARKLILRGRSSMETSVQEVMSSPALAEPKDTIDSCLHAMTALRLRHLVVMDGAKIEGIVSIGDLVKWMISAQSETIKLLSHYVTSGYPG
jgi:CBS domain-containing protein